MQRLGAVLLIELDGVGGADLLALAAEDALIRIEHRYLGDSRAEGDVDRATSAHVALELVRHLDGTGVLTQATADAVVLIDIGGLARDGGVKATVPGHQRVDLGEGPHVDVVVVRHR